MKHTLSALVIACMALGMQQAQAQSDAPAPQKTVKKADAKKISAGKKKKSSDADKEPDVSASTATDFHCELGNKLTVYHKADDDKSIALRWNKHLHHMSRVDTSTGAHRFENQKEGLVWIDLPSKGMLLDSRHGRQLANECKNTQQAQDTPKG